MGLIKRAPTVQVFVPTALFVGRPAVVEVVIEAAADLDVEYVDARIEGRQAWSVGAGDSRVSERATFPELATRLMGAGTLAAGTTRLAARFTLPEGTPPSHDLGPASASLTLAVRVAIPWWPDGRYTFTLPVRLPPPAVVARRPIAVRSTPAGAPPDAKRLELSLASSTLIAGETVVGSLAVYHVDDRKPREVELTLVPRLELLGRWRSRERDADMRGVTFTLPAGSAGTDVPFRFTLDAATIPTFATLTHRLRWEMVVRTGSFFGGKLELAVPVTIVDASAAEATPRLATAPRLADARIAHVFARFAAQHGWHVARADDAAGDVAIERAVGDAVVRITCVYRGEAGTFLESRVAHPSLGLELVVTPSTSLRHVFFEDIEVDIADWDRRHHVVARAAAQAIPMLRRAVPALQQATALGRLVRWNDDAIVFERAVASVETGALAPLAPALEQLAAALTAAAAAIPPPPGLTVDAAAWRQLARELDGPLSLGDLSIDGTLHGARVTLGVEWQAERPAGIRVAVGAADAASAELRARAFVLPYPVADVLREPAAEALIEQVTAWPADVVDLRLHDGVASALWHLPAGDPPTADAARVRDLVERLRAVLVALGAGGSPYR